MLTAISITLGLSFALAVALLLLRLLGRLLLAALGLWDRAMQRVSDAEFLRDARHLARTGEHLFERYEDLERRFPWRAAYFCVRNGAVVSAVVVLLAFLACLFFVETLRY